MQVKIKLLSLGDFPRLVNSEFLNFKFLEIRDYLLTTRLLPLIILPVYSQDRSFKKDIKRYILTFGVEFKIVKIICFIVLESNFTISNIFLEINLILRQR